MENYFFAALIKLNIKQMPGYYLHGKLRKQNQRNFYFYQFLTRCFIFEQLTG